MEFVIDPSERTLILAKTGGGKTVWAKYMLNIVARTMPVVIIDPNELWLGKGKGGHKSDWAQGKELGTVYKPRLIDTFNPKWRVQCLQPDVDGGEEDARLEKLCYDVLDYEDIFVYFDESEGIASANYVPKYIRRLWKTGRAHNVGCWVATQVPRGIPKIFKSQAEHFVIMKVGEEDVDFAEYLGHIPDEKLRTIPRFHWYHYYANGENDYATLHTPVPFQEVQP